MSKKKTAAVEDFDLPELPIQSLDELVDSTVTPNDIIETKTELAEEIPEFGSENWHSYVMSKLVEDELVDSNPTTSGLRRLVGTLIGPIVSSLSDVIVHPTPTNGMYTCVQHEMTVDFTPITGLNQDLRRFSDLAEVSFNNTSEMFAIFPTATASTRAEGRVLRKVLQLKNVIAAEEKSGELNLEDESAKIDKIQLRAIDNTCKNLDKTGIDVIKLVKGSKKWKYTTLLDMPKSVASNIMATLNSWQCKPELIPDELRGYQEGWKDKLEKEKE